MQGEKKRHGGARAGAGRKPFVPTAEQRLIVERSAGFGLTLEQIALLISNPDTKKPISHTTLIEHFRLELDRGRPKAIFAVANSLYMAATREKSVAAMIFYLKAQARWRDRIDVTVRRPDEMSEEELDVAIVASGLSDAELAAIAAAVENGSGVEDPALWPGLPAGENPTKH